MTGSSEPLRLGKYRVLDHVAEGPVADVLCARLDGIAGFSRRYALKRLKDACARQPEIVARFEEQARRAASLAHGNIVQVLDLGRDGEQPYVVAEWVDGWDLGRVLARAAETGTTVPVPHAAWIGWQVLKALEYAHERHDVGDVLDTADPFVHGALGIEDVLLSRGGEVKVSDFGLARVSDEVLASRGAGPVRPDRATPEQIAGQVADVATDLFAAAVVVGRMLLLKPPFVVDGEGGLTRAVAEGSTIDLAAARPDLPAPLAAALAAALVTDRALRPPSVRPLKEALGEAAQVVDGDVFTQETLAQWLRQLFGEPERWADASPVARASPDTLDMDDDAPPTSPGLDAFGDDAASLPVGGDRTEPHQAVAQARPTLVDQDDDDLRTAVGAGRIASASASRPVPTPPPKAPSERWDDNGSTEVDPLLSARIEALRAGRDTPADSPAPPAPPAGTWWTGGLVGAGLLALGALIGALVHQGMVQGGALVVNPPVLDVRLPEGSDTTVRVDGAPLGAARTVEPGPHTVRIEPAGAPPFELDLELAEGEYRLLRLDAVPLPPTPGSADDGEPAPADAPE